MSKDDAVLYLEIPSKKVVVKTKEGEQEFILEELPADRLIKYLDLRFGNYEKVREAAQKGETQEAFEKATNGTIEMLKLAFDNKVDEAWIEKNLTFSLRGKILETMDELCRVGELLGNVQALLQVSEAPETEATTE